MDDVTWRGSAGGSRPNAGLMSSGCRCRPENDTHGHQLGARCPNLTHRDQAPLAVRRGPCAARKVVVAAQTGCEAAGSGDPNAEMISDLVDGPQLDSVTHATVLLPCRAHLDQARKPQAAHDPGKILLDVAVAVAVGGNHLADVAIARAEPAVFGPVASDPTVSRLVDTLAAAGPRALAAIHRARAEVCDRACRARGPDTGGEVIMDIDGR
jgi:hypothetical protein